MEYDLNGNIIHLKRSGDANQGTTANLIDELNYEYQGNKVTSIVDERNNYQGYPDVSGNTIDYNDNGDMTSQKDKGILQIDYNHLNLADYFQFNTSYVIRNPLTGQNEVRNVKLDYLYRADGLKLRKKYTYFFSKGATERLTVTDYLDGFQYTISYNGRTSLDFISTSEGYFDFRQNKYIYNYTDHLGNVRLSYFNNGSGTEVLEENNYYPFGLKHGGYNELGGNPAYQYKYNGKELQTETGMYDYGARFYMPDIGRWGVVDPLAEQYRRHSTYNYTVNNPIRFVDPDGRGVNDFVRRSDGSIYWDKNANDIYSTKTGEDYLGKELYITFNSYIDEKLWDGPNSKAPGNKLTSTITLTGRENSEGELTSLVGSSSIEIGWTPVGTARDYYPGEGGSNNVFDMKTTSTGINVDFEQHASVPWQE
ncbi:RHS repeat-associated core domain-containing protein [uncultured Chryseobacterium sp.]|uniref:RHS repeat-associated core domain-containing protein n=1 Tax=uncultured Chryseobacterium sp. TaxID=259322 RepID=UPI0025EBE4E9|nr:RHS repeat-associated core domain-containing protein [uncultured Chryseobacterium sp.]